MTREEIIKNKYNLFCTNLHDVYLYDADLRRADIYGADLSDAKLCGADLYDADLSRADLRGADLRHADLRHADLRRADLRGADLRGADLRDADLRRAKLRGAIGIPPISCPEEGSFIAFKKANGFIVKLLIPEDARRSSATTRKCRCDKAIVLEILNTNMTEIPSSYDKEFVYRVGEIVSVDNFDNDRWNECAPGIHFFITKQEAMDYGI